MSSKSLDDSRGSLTDSTIPKPPSPGSFFLLSFLAAVAGTVSSGPSSGGLVAFAIPSPPPFLGGTGFGGVTAWAVWSLSTSGSRMDHRVIANAAIPVASAMAATHALLDLRMVVFDILELKNLILSVRTAKESFNKRGLKRQACPHPPKDTATLSMENGRSRKPKSIFPAGIPPVRMKYWRIFQIPATPMSNAL